MKNQRGAAIAQNSPVKYYSIAQARFVRRVKEETGISTPRTIQKGPNEGKVVHEEHYDEITGQLIDIKFEESDYGRKVLFILDTTIPGQQEEKSQIQVNLSSGYAKNIMSRLPLIDFDKDITLKGYRFTPKGETKERIGVSVLQQSADGTFQSIPSFYTKETPNGMPKLKKVKVKGVEVWDDTDIIEFFEAKIKEETLPKLRALSPSIEATPAKPESAEVQPEQESPEDFDEDQESDDLPF